MGKKIWEMIDRCARVILLKTLHLSFLEERWETFTQFLKFGLVGILNNIIYYIIYLLCVFTGMHYLLANVFGFAVSVINAFFWNNRYVFRKNEGETRNLWQSFFKTVLSYAGTGLVLNHILLYLQIDLLHWPKSIAPLLNLVITVPLNFLLNKLWAFRKK